MQKNNNAPESTGALQLALTLAPLREGEVIHRPQKPPNFQFRPARTMFRLTVPALTVKEDGASPRGVFPVVQSTLKGTLRLSEQRQ